MIFNHLFLLGVSWRLLLTLIFCLCIELFGFYQFCQFILLFSFLLTYFSVAFYIASVFHFSYNSFLCCHGYSLAGAYGMFLWVGGFLFDVWKEFSKLRLIYWLTDLWSKKKMFSFYLPKFSEIFFIWHQLNFVPQTNWLIWLLLQYPTWLALIKKKSWKTVGTESSVSLGFCENIFLFTNLKTFSAPSAKKRKMCQNVWNHLEIKLLTILTEYFESCETEKLYEPLYCNRFIS